MNSPLILLLVLAVVGYAIYKQMTPHVVGPLGSELKRPAILVIVGVVTSGSWLTAGDNAGVITVYVISAGLVVLSLVAGAMRGATIPLRVHGDRVIRKGNATTLAIWLGLITTKVAVGVLVLQRPPVFGEILFFIGLSLGVQAMVTARRADELTAAPARVPASATC